MNDERGPATAPPPVAGKLALLARWLIRRRHVVLVLAGLAVTGAALAGLGVQRHLSSGAHTTSHSAAELPAGTTVPP